MYLSEGIIDNFIESIDEADMMRIEELSDEDAYKYIASLYKRSYGASPSGTGIFLIRSKFNLGCKDANRKFIPSALF